MQDKKLIVVLLLVSGGMAGAVLCFPSPKGQCESATQVGPPPPAVASASTDALTAIGQPPSSWHAETDQLWTRVVQRQFADRSEVASGRFLANFDDESELLEGIDLADAQGIVRTSHWLRAVVPVQRGEKTEWVRVRLVLEDGAWKIEDLRETRAPNR